MYVCLSLCVYMSTTPCLLIPHVALISGVKIGVELVIHLQLDPPINVTHRDILEFLKVI